MYGEVVGGYERGVIIRLENGREVFASFGSLPKGTRVLCSVPEMLPGKWVRVIIEAVIDYAQAA